MTPCIGEGFCTARLAACHCSVARFIAQSGMPQSPLQCCGCVRWASSCQEKASSFALTVFGGCCPQVTDPDERQKLYDEYIVRLKEKRAGKRFGYMPLNPLLSPAAPRSCRTW